MANIYIDSLNKNKYEKYKFLKTMWMMYVLFPFRLKGIATVQNIIYYGISFACVISFFYILEKKGVNKNYFGYTVSYVIIMCLLLIYSYFIVVIKNTMDYSYLSNLSYYFGRVVILTGTTVLVRSFFSYVKLIINAIDTYVLFSLILLVPAIHNFYMNILIVDTSSMSRASELYSQDYYTRFGLQGFSGFGSTIMCTIAVLLSCYMLIISIRNNSGSFYYIKRIIVSLVGTAMYGRIGFIISILLIITTILYLSVIYKKFNILICTAIMFIMLLLIFIFNSSKLQQISSIRWMFEWFFNYLNYGTFSTSSSSKLSEMYIQPGMNTILYGDGFYTVGGQYYMNTDVGFLRPLLYGGIVFEIVYYATMIPPILSLRKYLRGYDNIFLIFMFLILLVVFEFKGETLLTVSGILYALSVKILLSMSNDIRRKL